MSADTRTFDNVRDVLLSARKIVSSADMVNLYNTWAENYNKDVVAMEYHSPVLAAKVLSGHFTGDREKALVLDVACGTGLVATEMKKHGYGHFVGLDGCVAMLEMAKNTGLYQDLKQCMLGAEELPVQWGTFDIVVIVGGLSVCHVPIACVRQLCNITKPGGLICMTTRAAPNNLVYKASLEQELKQMEEERLWTCVNVTEVEEFQLTLAEHQENKFMGGCVYLYRVSSL